MEKILPVPGFKDYSDRPLRPGNSDRSLEDFFTPLRAGGGGFIFAKPGNQNPWHKLTG